MGTENQGGEMLPHRGLRTGLAVPDEAVHVLTNSENQRRVALGRGIADDSYAVPVAASDVEVFSDETAPAKVVRIDMATVTSVQEAIRPAGHMATAATTSAVDAQAPVAVTEANSNGNIPQRPETNFVPVAPPAPTQTPSPETAPQPGAMSGNTSANDPTGTSGSTKTDPTDDDATNTAPVEVPGSELARQSQGEVRHTWREKRQIKQEKNLAVVALQTAEMNRHAAEVEQGTERNARLNAAWKAQLAANEAAEAAALSAALEAERLAAVEAERVATNEQIEAARVAENQRLERVSALNSSDAVSVAIIGESLARRLNDPNPLAPGFNRTVMGAAFDENFVSTKASLAASELAGTEAQSPGRILGWHGVPAETSKRTALNAVLGPITEKLANGAGVRDSDDLDAHSAVLKELSSTVDDVVIRSLRGAVSSIYRYTDYGVTTDREAHELLATTELLTTTERSEDEHTTDLRGNGTKRHILIDQFDLKKKADGKHALVKVKEVAGVAEIMKRGQLWVTDLPGIRVEGIVQTPNHHTGASAVVLTYSGDEVVTRHEDGTPNRIAVRTEVVVRALTPQGTTIGLAALAKNVTNSRNIVDPVSPLIIAVAGAIGKADATDGLGEWIEERELQGKNSYDQLPPAPTPMSMEPEEYAAYEEAMARRAGELQAAAEAKYLEGEVVGDTNNDSVSDDDSEYSDQQ